MTATENNDGILPKIYVIYNRRKTKKGKKKYIMKTYSANAPNITTNITSQLKRRKKKSSPKIRETSTSTHTCLREESPVSSM